MAQTLLKKLGKDYFAIAPPCGEGSFRGATLNVGTIHDRVNEIIDIMRTQQLHVLALQETRLHPAQVHSVTIRFKAMGYNFLCDASDASFYHKGMRSRGVALVTTQDSYLDANPFSAKYPARLLFARPPH